MADAPDPCAVAGLTAFFALRSREGERFFDPVVAIASLARRTFDLDTTQFVDLSVAVVINVVPAVFVISGLNQRIVVVAIKGRGVAVFVFVLLGGSALVADADLAFFAFDVVAATVDTDLLEAVAIGTGWAVFVFLTGAAFVAA